MLITVGSLKGSPGATTFAALLARMWPTDTDPDAPADESKRGGADDENLRVLLEADPDGGVLAAQWHEALAVAWSPGVAEFAAAARGSSSMTSALLEVGQPVGGGVVLVPALPNRAAMSSAVAGFSDAGLAEVARSPVLVVADIGRVRPETLGLVRRSQLTVLVCRPSLTDAQLLAPIVTNLSDIGGRVGIVTVGNEGYPPGEVAQAAGVDPLLAWSIPTDDRGAAVIGSRGLGLKAVARCRVGRAVRTIAQQIADQTTATSIRHELVVARQLRNQAADDPGVSSALFGEVVNRG